MNETSLKSTNKVFCFNSKGTGKAKKLSKTVQLKKKTSLFNVQANKSWPDYRRAKFQLLYYLKLNFN